MISPGPSVIFSPADRRHPETQVSNHGSGKRLDGACAPSASLYVGESWGWFDWVGTPGWARPYPPWVPLWGKSNTFCQGKKKGMKSKFWKAKKRRD